MRRGNALFGMYGASAVEFAAPDRADLCTAIRQSRKSHGRAFRRLSIAKRVLSTPTGLRDLRLAVAGRGTATA